MFVAVWDPFPGPKRTNIVQRNIGVEAASLMIMTDRLKTFGQVKIPTTGCKSGRRKTQRMTEKPF